MDRRTNVEPLKAHGREYNTMAAVAARVTELSFLNRINGESDGRVTEQLTIWDALIQYADDLEAEYPTDAVHMALANQTYLTANDAPVLSVFEELAIAVANTNKGMKPVIS